MNGFFTAEEVKSTTRKVKHETCAVCGLYKTVRTPRMEAFGNCKRAILNVGEGPGEFEDRRGRQWQGKVGKVLQEAYKMLGFDLFEHCININSVNCRPMTKDGNNRAPDPKEINCCRSRVLKVIEQYKPKLIVLFGNSAIMSLIGHRWKKDLGGIFKWRGWAIPDRDFNAWLCPVFHPSFTERSEREVETIWMQDLKHALSMTDEPLPKFDDESKQIMIVDECPSVSEVESPFSVDFETTGLKCHDVSVHSIVCVAVCDNKNRAWVFMMNEVNKRRLRRLLMSDKGKIAQNLKFENSWAQNLLDCEVRNWVWDTMLASHVLNNRSDITS